MGVQLSPLRGLQGSASSGRGHESRQEDSVEETKQETFTEPVTFGSSMQPGSEI